MGRKSRLHFDGALFHCWARGVDRRTIFSDDADYSGFMDILEGVLRGSNGKLVAYCLMPNHFHLLVQVSTVTLSVIMQRALTRYATRFNRRHERVGHLFQERFRERLCDDNAYLSRIIPYIHLNPVRAGLVHAPELWRWSSQYKFPIENVDLTGFDPWEDSTERSVDLCRKEVKNTESLEEMIGRVATKHGVDTEIIRTACKCPAVVAARKEAASMMSMHGDSASKIALFLRVSVSSICRLRQENRKIAKPDTVADSSIPETF